MSLVTIITPTYNRSKELVKLYNSLNNQTNMDFVWLIVDDGSLDCTESVVNEFRDNSNYELRYIKKENGGKHSALNFGISKIETELTFIVDSDDELLSNAIDIIYQLHSKYVNNKSIAAYSFLRCDEKGIPIVGLNEEEFIANYIKYRIKGKKPGDMAEVFRTNVLRKYPFPEFNGEKFLSEDVVWIEIGKKYDYVFINIPIYVCKYLDDGLTSNDKPMKFSSPMGSMLRGKQLMSEECGIIQNIKGAIIYNCYKTNEVDSRVKIERKKDKILLALTKPLGWFYRKKWRT